MPAIEWQIATLKKIKQETAKVKSFTLALPNFAAHKAGQHYDIRLTAADGYRAQRSYSIASAPELMGGIDITVDRIPDGEVSTYLHDVLVEGDRIEVRGPIGGYFVWETALGGPLLLIGGGSGIVPLMSMLRHRFASKSAAEARLLASWRTYEDIIYRDELEKFDGKGFQLFQTLTRAQPAGWKGYARRVDSAMLDEVAGPLGKQVKVFICGPTAFVESAADSLAQAGIPPAQIKTERFGPTGS